MMGRRVTGPSDYELLAVSYMSGDNLRELLAPLPEQVPLVVVDNAQNRDRVRELVSARPHGRYIDSGGGKGFAKAANMGARTSGYDYIVFVNPDSRPQAAVIEALVEQLRSDPGLGAVAATLVHPGGGTEIGVGGWEPSVARAAVQALGVHKRFSRLGIWAQPKAGEEVSLDWLSGGCMAVRRQTFLDLGCFDERYFVYNEDMTFGRSLRLGGYRQELRTDLLVPHAAGSSGGSTNMARLRGASFVDYVRRHNSPVAAQTMRLLLVFGTLARVVQRTLQGDRARAAMFLSYATGLVFGTGVLPGVPEVAASAQNSDQQT
jgi:N-acetylglucosaminyl-diphospho-decaprenol L-rhamnosyltransferase